MAARGAGPGIDARSNQESELRVLLLTLEYAEPWIFSGNGVYSRSFVHNLVKSGDTRIQVVCGRPAGQQIRARPQPTTPSAASTKEKTSPGSTAHPGTATDGVEVIREGNRVEVYTVSLPVWFKLDRQSSWKEFGEGVARFAKAVGDFRPDIVLGVDWTSRLAWETLKKLPAVRLHNVPFIYLCFRVFSSTPGLSQEDRTFYAQREAETIQSAVRTVALSRCDAVALDALRTMTLPRGADALRASANLIQVITPPLRDDVRNASLKLTRLPTSNLLSVAGSTSSTSRKKWSWAHSQLSSANHPPFPGSGATGASDSASFASRIFITCCCRISPEKEIMRFVEIVESIQHFMKENELVPYIVGPPADEEYARKVYQRLKRAFPGDSSIIVSDFVPADRLQSIFAKTLLNIHPARMEPFGMTITEAAAFGVPTLLDGSGLIGATDVLPFSDNCSVACNMKSLKQASLVTKTLLRKEGRSFLELIGKRAQDAVLRWGSAEWAMHVRRELLDDVLKNAFRAYDDRLVVRGGNLHMNGKQQSFLSPGHRSNLNEADEQEEHAHDGDETWPWMPMTEWVATQLSLGTQHGGESQVLDFDLDGVRLVVEQLLKLSAYSFASLLLTIKQEKEPLPVEMDADMYEWAWYLLSKHNACLGPARFRLVPSRMSEDTFWGLLFAIVRDGVVRLVTSCEENQQPRMRSGSKGETPFLQPGEEFRHGSPEPVTFDGNGGPKQPPSFTSPLDIKTEAMERLVQRDECARGITPIVEFVGKGVLAESAHALFNSNRVLILTGFPCLQNAPNPQETDGPPGSVAIAKACISLGKRVLFVIEEPMVDVLRAAIVQVFPKTRSMLLRAHEGITRVETFGSKGQVTMEVFPSRKKFTPQHYERLHAILAELAVEQAHMVAIERAGPCSDGTCRTMKGRIMGDELLAPLHVLFEKAKDYSIPTTGIGDGGNEVGMGAAYEVVRAKINAQIACVVGCDFLLPCSVSNWGGYALAAALSLVALQHEARFTGPNKHSKVLEACIGSDAQLEAIAKACVDAGGADGVTGNRETVSVDGLPFSKSLEVVQGLRKIVESFDVDESQTVL